VDAGEAVRGGPVDRHVAVVPAGRVGVARGGATQSGRRLVYVDTADGGAAAVARGVRRAAGGALARSLVQRPGTRAGAHPREAVAAGVADGHIAVVPAGAVGGAVRRSAYRGGGQIGRAHV